MKYAAWVLRFSDLVVQKIREPTERLPDLLAMARERTTSLSRVRGKQLCTLAIIFRIGITISLYGYQSLHNLGTHLSSLDLWPLSNEGLI